MSACSMATTCLQFGGSYQRNFDFYTRNDNGIADGFVAGVPDRQRNRHRHACG